MMFGVEFSFEQSFKTLFRDVLAYLYQNGINACDYDVAKLTNILWRRGARRFYGTSEFFSRAFSISSWLSLGRKVSDCEN